MRTKVFPTLYGTASGGKTKVYKIKVIDNEITMEHGYEDGKMAVQKRTSSPKNVGKSNETTPFDQACSDAQSKWNKKKDEGYTETKKAQKTQELLLPMLALKYTDRKKDIKFPCYVQPKLDGVRNIYTNGTFNSRGGKPFTTLNHLIEECDILQNGLESYNGQKGVGAPLDGEIYCHNEITFQDVIAAVKKTSENTPKLKYYIYDLADSTLTFEERIKKLQEFFKKMEKSQYLVLVPTYEVKNEEEIIKYHEQFIKDGYEGIIIRNKDGKYTFKHRSKDLQKWKNFVDKEFKIIGGKEATGEDSGTVVFILDNGDGQTFECRPRGSRELRREWFKNLESLKGRRLTVRYQNLSDSGIPRFPVGITIRDYE